MTTREKFLELVRTAVVLRTVTGGGTTAAMAVRCHARALCLPEWAPHPADLAAVCPSEEEALAVAALEFVGWCWGDRDMPPWMGRVAACLRK
jgi:hypothetical protein